jgi:hypothetical protein
MHQKSDPKVNLQKRGTSGGKKGVLLGALLGGSGGMPPLDKILKIGCLTLFYSLFIYTPLHICTYNCISEIILACKHDCLWGKKEGGSE